jgi:Uma2 family endonuclease
MVIVSREHPDIENGIHYPCSDGKPMAETDFHVDAIRLLLDALDDYFADRSDAYVAGNVFWYWREEHPSKRRAPDAMVVFGVEKRKRRSFRSWNEGGAVPAACFAVASGRTWRKDLGSVYRDYEANAVREYFVFDPTRDYLDAPLLGFRRRGKKFHPIRPDSEGAMESRELGLGLVPEGIKLRLVDLATGKSVFTRTEQTNSLTAEVDRLRAQLRQGGRNGNGPAHRQ